MSSAKLLKYFRASERDAIEALNFSEAFRDHLDATMYPGYHEDLLESCPAAYSYEFSQFLKNYGGAEGEVLEPQ